MLSRLLLLAVCCLHFTQAEAHTRSESFSRWVQDGRHYRFVFRVDARRVTQLAALYEHTDTQRLLRQHLEETLSVTQQSRPCLRKSLQVTAVRQGNLQATGFFECDNKDTSATAHVSSFTSVSAAHLHLASVRFQNSNKRQKHVLAGGAGSFPLSSGADPQSFGDFARLGVIHIFSGVDHLAFLLALLLAAGGIGRAIWCITGFTLGHSLSLAAVALGYIWPQSQLIEALIGFTIAFAAIEIARNQKQLAFGYLALAGIAVLAGALSGQSQLFWFSLGLAVFALSMHGLPPVRTRQWLPTLAVAFGLAHGAGFAGGLLSLELNRNELLIPLFGFNIGVELAQVSIALLVCILWQGWRHFGYKILGTKSKLISGKTASTSLASLLLGLGLYWFTLRLWQNGIIF